MQAYIYVADMNVMISGSALILFVHAQVLELNELYTISLCYQSRGVLAHAELIRLAYLGCI